MELIYLWVEHYKNINKLGFSLNPNYEVKFDRETHIIECNENNYHNIFKNKNIITIVGQNGSGKSSICKSLAYILRNSSETCFKQENFYYENSDNYINFSQIPKCFLLLKNEDKFILKSNCDINGLKLRNNGIDCEITFTDEKYDIGYFQPFLEIEDDFILDFPLDQASSEITRKKLNNYFYYDRFRIYDTTHSLKNLFQKTGLKLLEENPNLVFDKYGYEIDIKFMLFWLNRQLKRVIENYYKPADFSYGQLWSFIDSFIRENEIAYSKWEKLEKNDNPTLINSFCNIFLSRFCVIFLIIQIGYMYNYLSKKNCYKDTNKILSINNSLEILLNLSCFNNSLDDNSLKDAHKRLLKCLSKLEIEILKIEDQQCKFVKNILKLLDVYIELEKIFNIKIKEFIEYMEFDEQYNVLRLKTDKMLEVGVSDSFIDFLNKTGIFRLNFYRIDNVHKTSYTFNSLSSGEQRILRFFADVLSIIEIQENGNKTSNFIFDEMDLSWHPEWQRKMVYYVDDLFEHFCSQSSLNIIFTTHSPFILSDMPSNNIIMLNKGRNNLATKVPNLICTLGANIYDLYDNGFFLKKCDDFCTIGEFAKQKIIEVQSMLKLAKDEKLQNKFLDSYHKKTLFEEINMIGDPLIKKVLLREFYSIYREYTQEDLFVENCTLKEYINILKGFLNEKDNY